MLYKSMNLRLSSIGTITQSWACAALVILSAIAVGEASDQFPLRQVKPLTYLVDYEPGRATYERDAIYQILDEGFVCHVGFIADGQPIVIPTAYGRAGDILYIHGSVASRMLRALADGIQVCVTVTLVDGLVLARSAFHHSMNYRSVVVFGTAHAVENAIEKAKALLAFSEHVIPGRWAEVREPNGTSSKRL